MTPVLDRRRLNRALPARQLLFERRAAGPTAVIARLVGMQAQADMVAPECDHDVRIAASTSPAA